MRQKTGWAILASFLLFAGLFSQESERAAKDELVIKARAMLAAFEGGDFQAAAKDFDETMMKVSGPDKLEDFWKQVPEKLGVFKRQTAAPESNSSFTPSSTISSSRAREFPPPTNTPSSTAASPNMSSTTSPHLSLGDNYTGES